MSISILIICILILILIYTNISTLHNSFYKVYNSLYPIKNKKIETSLEKVNKMSNEITNYIHLDINTKVQDVLMREIAIYSLNYGKKLRPILIISMFKQITKKDMENIPDYIINSALAIEYIHSASLIIDDIQDKDDKRRDKNALHIQYGLSKSQLCAILLCALSYQNIFLSLENLFETSPQANKDISIILNKIISDKLKQLTEGQLKDITNDYYVKQKITDNDINILIDLIHKKTSTLFELCFIIPWIYSNITLTSEEFKKGIDDIKELAKLFGLIYQISDDFEDVEQDCRKMSFLNRGENIPKNYVVFRGKENAYKDYYNYVNEFETKINKVNMYSLELKEIIKYLNEKTNTYYC